MNDILGYNYDKIVEFMLDFEWERGEKKRKQKHIEINVV